MTGRPNAAKRPLGGALAAAASALGLAVVFAISLVAGLYLHLDLGVTRAAVRDVVNAVLRQQLAGRVELGAIDALTPNAITVRSFTTDAPGGARVLEVERLQLEGPWLHRLLRRFSGAPLSLPPLRVERATVDLAREDDELAIARAFASRDPTPEAKPPAPSKVAELISLPHIAVGQIRVVGDVSAGVAIDGTLSAVEAAVVARTDGVDVHVDRCEVTEPKVLGAPARADVDVHLVVDRVEDRSAARLWGNLAGEVGALRFEARVSFDDGELAAALEVPKIGPEELSPWVPNAPLSGAATARATVVGKLPDLDITADIGLPATGGGEAGQVALWGRVRVADRPELDATLRVEHLDGRFIGREHTDLDARARLHGVVAGADTAVLGLVRVAPSWVEQQPVGPLEGTVRIARAGVDACFRLDEAGAPTDISFHFLPEDGGVSFAARSEVDLAAATRLSVLLRQPGPNRGHAQLAAEGRFDDGELDVATKLSLRGVRWPAQRASLVSATVDGRITGKPDALKLDARATGAGLLLDEEPVESFQVTARGPLGAPLVQARAVARGRQVAVSAALDPENRRATGVKLDVTHGHATVTTTVAAVTAAPGGVVLDRIEIDGLGPSILGGLRVQGGELFGKLHGKGVDLANISRVLGLPFNLRGSLDVDLDLRPDKGGRSGHLSAKIHDAGYLILDGVSGEIRADFDGKHVVPSAELRVVNAKVREGNDDRCGGHIATVKIDDAEGTTSGPLLEPTTWRDLAGSMRVSAKDVKLECLAEVWQQYNPARELPFRRLEGLLNATAVLSRDSRQRFLSVSGVNASTTGLVYAPHPEAGAEQPAFVSDELDLVLFGALDGKTGHTEVALHLVESSKRSDLARLQVDASLDLPLLLAGGKGVGEALLDTKLSATLHSKRGAVARWAALPDPARAQVAAIEGDIAVDAFLEGTLRDPSAALRLRAWGLGHIWGLPTDVDVLANYHGGVARLDAKVLREGAQVAVITGEAKGNVAERILLPDAAHESFTGWVSANLRRLPLETLPPLAAAQISGVVTGYVKAQGLGDEPSVVVQMDMPKLKVGRVKLRDAQVVVAPVRNRPGIFTLFGKLPHEAGGGITVRGYGSLKWKDRLLPSPDVSKAAGLHVHFDRFPLATLEPAVVGTVSRLDGYLDGGVRVRYHDLGASKAAIDVKLKVVDGVVHLPGQELTEITASVSSKPSMILVKDISIRSNQGKATGSLSARVDGIELDDVTGTLKAEADTPMPLIVEGVPIGSASGTLVVHYQRGTPDKVELSVADLILNIPASQRGNVQTLDDHSEITVSLPLGPPKHDEPEEEGKGRPVQVTVALDKAVIESGQARIVLSTTSALVIDSDGGMQGEIAVVGGNLNLLGKVFVFDRGLVRFHAEDKSNPYVNVTARWTAPDGTLIYVDYVGLAKALSDEKITFRSVPPLSQEQILSLLLLGDTDAGTDRAANLTRGIAAAQFNALLGDIAPGLSTSFATEGGVIGTTLIYQLSDSVTASATLEQADTSGANGDTATSGGGGDQGSSARTSVSIDWRFARHWLLRGTLGVGEQASSGLDVLYQFRY